MHETWWRNRKKYGRNNIVNVLTLTHVWILRGSSSWQCVPSCSSHSVCGCVCLFAFTLQQAWQWRWPLCRNELRPTLCSITSSLLITTLLWFMLSHTSPLIQTHTSSCYSVVPAVRSQVLVHPSSPHLISIKWHHSISWCFSKEVSLPWNEY